MSDLGPTQRDAAERIIVGLSEAVATVRAEAMKAALEEAAALADERGAATTATAIRALIAALEEEAGR